VQPPEVLKKPGQNHKNGLPKPVVLRQKEAVTLNSHFQGFMSTGKLTVLLMLMNQTMKYVTMT
jgi:hypothetical protein